MMSELSSRNSLRLLERSARLALRRLSLLALIVISLACAAANAKELRIENFDSHIVVSRDGTINVTEKIEAHFIGGPWHGLYRSIPV